MVGGDESPKVALVAGATGLVGRELVNALLANVGTGWKKVYGVARMPPDEDGDDDDDHHHHHQGVNDYYQLVRCDLLDREETMEKLSSLKEQVTHVFWVTWASQYPVDTQECCEQNRAMLSNALDAILPTLSIITHFALQTGTKHYLSLRGRSGVPPPPPGDVVGPSSLHPVVLSLSSSSSSYYDEESPRDGGAPNFYYALEDLLKERLQQQLGAAGRGERRISWSVHRPGLLLGASRRSHFNFIGSLCVYATICAHLGLPFLFGGERRCWEESYIDASDARLVAQQQIWWASSTTTTTSPSPSPSSSPADGHAFNAVNGPAFTWKEVWPALASTFGLTATTSNAIFSPTLTYSGLMADKGGVWEEIVDKKGLRRTKMEDLANWGFLDALFRFPTKMLVSRRKSDRLGFTTTYGALDSILYWVDRMRSERLVP